MNYRLIPLFVLGVAILIAVANAQPIAAPENQENETVANAEFEGKVVRFSISGPKRGTGLVLTDVKLVKIGNRMMIVGTGADTGDDENWTTDVRIGFPWDSVTAYYAMTKKQFKKKALENRIL